MDKVNIIALGPLLKKILDDSKNKMNDDSYKRKLYLYAGHDSTVANILQALKVWDPQIPKYNILALIELHKIDDDYKIKVTIKFKLLLFILVMKILFYNVYMKCQF